MIIFLTALNKMGKVHEFACGLGSLEANFDFLNSIVSEGNSLLTVYMLEGTRRTDLPLTLFDGLPFSQTIRELKQEWEAILNKPVYAHIASFHQETMAALTCQRIHQYEVKIASHKRMIDYFTQWLQRTQGGHSSGPVREKLIYQYQSTIDRYQKQLIQMQFHSTLATNRLNELQA